MNVMTIKPLSCGWALGVTGLAADMLFLSGAAAEQAARRLAERLATEGMASKLVIHLKDGSVGGRFLFPPAMESLAADRWGRAA